MSSLSVVQVLFLQGLSITLGETYSIKWELQDYQRFDCHPEDNADEAKCTARGCIWKVRTNENFNYFLQPEQMECSNILILLFQSSNFTKVPWCYYPDDYGYTVTESNVSSAGMTANIIRNKKYRSSGRPNSSDIDTLSVEIRYHTSHMLQFKVCALTLSRNLPCTHFLLTETFTPHRSGIQPQIVMRFQCHCQYPRPPRLPRARGSIRSLLPRSLLGSRS